MTFIALLTTALCTVVSATSTAPIHQDDAAQAFAAQCAMCHGVGGGGDGAAAGAMDPKPTNLKAAEYQEGRSDDEIAAAIKDGKGSMPAYGGRLSEDQIAGLVAYIRELGKQ